ncbi:hypothetical protein BDZ90DRAFT_50027 [Jaminaea rosea]|uniref:Uncharacterized protein n=1 Tax=Jaminaea rosea TaxID=1569628 RepID=A0A316ULX6_9BASI|nr:hypothetical protein BDZ90DRAFT_50027 [Jaminaea rosea]PWN26249.1 hypothetical protein BDZ90DRAFT_50027 [Jaminaea rosea]
MAPWRRLATSTCLSLGPRHPWPPLFSCRTGPPSAAKGISGRRRSHMAANGQSSLFSRLLEFDASVHRSFCDGKRVVDDTRHALSRLDAPSTALAMHILIDGLLRKMSAVHLTSDLVDVVVEGLHSIRASTGDINDGQQQARWEAEICDILDNFALRLVSFPDHRARNASLDLVELATALDVDAHRIARIINIICGGLQEADHPKTSSTTPSAAIAFPIAPLQIYDRAFADTELCTALLETSRHCGSKQQVLSIISAFLRVPAEEEQDLQRADQLLNLARRLTLDEGGPPPEIFASYADALLQATYVPPGYAFRMAADFFDDQVIKANSLSDPLRSRVWGTLVAFDPTLAAGADQPFTITNLWSRPHGSPRDSVAAGPHPHLASHPAFLQHFLSGLGSLPAFTKQVLRAGMHMWDHCVRRYRVQPTPRIASNAVRLSILGDSWGDAVDLLQSWVTTSTEQQHAVSKLAEELEALSGPLRRINSSPNVKAWSDPAAVGMLPAMPSSRLPRTLMGTTLNSHRPMACWAVWKHSPGIAGCPHDHFSLLALLSGARHAARLDVERRIRSKETRNRQEMIMSHDLEADVDALLSHQPWQRDNNDSSPLWDGLPPALRAKAVFRHIIFSQHPDLRTEVSAVEACRAALSWRPFRTSFKASELSIVPSSSPEAHSSQSGTRAAYYDSESCDEEQPGSLVDDCGRSLPWTSVVFGNDLFEGYLSLLCIIRLLENGEQHHEPHSHRVSTPFSFLSGSDDVWTEPLMVLSWMRRLSLQPSREIMGLVSLTAFRDLPLWSQNLSADASLMGPIDAWCREWVDADNFPIRTDILGVENRLLRQSLPLNEDFDERGGRPFDEGYARPRRKERRRAQKSAGWYKGIR